MDEAEKCGGWDCGLSRVVRRKGLSEQVTSEERPERM